MMGIGKYYNNVLGKCYEGLIIKVQESNFNKIRITNNEIRNNNKILIPNIKNCCPILRLFAIFWSI
jgi:hypothetical protein